MVEKREITFTLNSNFLKWYTPLLKSHPDLKNVLETPPISYENLAMNE